MAGARVARARRLGAGLLALGYAGLGVFPLPWHQGLLAGLGGLAGFLLPLPWARVPMALGLAAAALPGERAVRLGVAVLVMVGALALLGRRRASRLA